jgi:hypothetical protein
VAKEPETQERFRIFCEVEPEKLGGVIATLTKIGVSQVHHELITDVLAYKVRKEYQVNEVNSREFARDYVKDHPTFAISDLFKHFIAAGRSGAGAYSSARLLIEEGVLRKLGPGQYQSVNVKALPAPKGKVRLLVAPEKPGNAAKPANTAKVKAPRGRKAVKDFRYYEVSNKDFLLGLLKGRTEIHASVVTEAFVKAGRPERSAGSMMTQLGYLGYIKKMGEGTWKVLAKAHRVTGPIAKRRVTPRAEQQINGADTTPATTQVEVTNG